MNLKKRKIESEITFKTSRSSGKGGQNVNKVETKVEAIFNIPDSYILTEEEKETISKKIKSKLDSEGNIRVISQASRSQLKNKADAVEKLIDNLEKALVKKKKRKPTKPSKESKEKRIKEKKSKGEKKQLRKTPRIE